MIEADVGALGEVSPGEAEPRGGLDRPRWAALHVRIRLLLVALVSFGVTIAGFALRSVSLPYDREYAAVLFLMWPRRGLGLDVAEAAVAALELICLAVPLVLLAGAVLPRWMLHAPPGVIRWTYRHALVIPVLALAVTTVSRFVSNGIYALAPLITWDFTSPIAIFEAPLIEALQASLESPVLSDICAVVYAGGWLVTLLAAVPALMLLGRDEAAGRLAAGWIVAAIAAGPFFLLLPVFEPWAFNPAYGYVGEGATNVRFLATSAMPELGEIAVNLRWATASCFPSLHVGLPVLASLICFQQRLRALGWFYAGLASLVALSVIYLGRHWIVDVPVGAAFAVLIAGFSARLRPERLLFWPGTLGRS